MATAEIKAVITADDQASDVVGKFGQNIAGVGATLAVVGAAMVAFGVSAVNSFSESEAVGAQLNAVLKSTGGVAGVTAESVTGLANALQKSTRYSDEQIGVAENMLLTFTKIGKDIFPDTTKAVLDMATAMGTDLKSTSIQVGKALQDPVRGVTALQRVGVRLTDSQKALVESLVAVGDTAGAQKIILQELQTEFGGSAEAAGKTFAGQLDILRNALDNVMEQIGGVIAKALQPFIEKVKPVAEAIQNWIDKNPQLVTAIVGVGAAIAVATLAVGALALAFAGLDAVASPWLAIAAAIVAGVVALGFAVNWLANTFGGWSVVLKEVTSVFNTYIKPALLDVWNTIQTQLLPVLREFWNQNKNWLIPALQGLAIILGVVIVGSILVFLVAVKMIVQGLTALVSVINWVQAQVRSLIGSFNSLPSQFQAIGGAILQALIWPFQTAFTIISAIFSAIRSSAGSIANIATGGLLQARAGGGSVSGGQPYIVGEQGPELFVPGTSGNIIPNNKLTTGGGSTNQTTININVGLMTGSAIERREAAAKMFEDLKDIAGMQGQTVAQMIGT